MNEYNVLLVKFHQDSQPTSIIDIGVARKRQRKTRKEQTIVEVAATNIEVSVVEYIEKEKS